jgi:hypothetical protein
MRLHRLRLRLRTSLIAVALIAATLSAGLMWRRVAAYRARAADAADASEIWAVSAKTSEAASAHQREDARRQTSPHERSLSEARASEFAEHAAICRTREAHHPR